MPRGRGRKKRGPYNVQNKLTTRLMQINLKMDDHLYCNKTVSKATAAELLQEATTLKMKCPRKDVRTLQVIDKVATFMKNIIAVDQEQEARLPTPNIPDYFEFSQTHSPVYSLADGDKIENATFCSSDDIPMIDITEDTNDMFPNEQNNAIDNVNFAISNMAIQDEIMSQIEVLSDDDCSQSILENFHNGNTAGQDDTRIGTVNMTGLIDNNNTVNHISKELSHDSLNNTANNQVIIEPIKQIENPALKTLENTASTSTTDKQQVSVSDENIKVVQRKNSNDTKKATKKRKPKSKDTNKDEATGIINQKKNPRKRKKKSVVIPIDAKSDPPINDTVPKIYDRSVENDLSWIENLRFIREVGPDENDATLCNMEENFWDNFSLPSQWNDQDFDY